ncbi:MAG TPA: MqnA/MqnD/SBP family protein [Humisphaera sp.]|jgi:1,4-dihydroxy-6-naphthoate synthase|nr:MqnA/MqnD/SBP family protein [Humisphaera sp.]
MEQRLLRLGHSPDPDDAFMFYGLARELIPTGRWRFEHVLQDIQTLNQRAMKGELEITAISIHAYPYVADRYALTSCGSSMGDNYGPMVVCRADRKGDFGGGRVPNLKGKKIAIPGKLTTAFLSLQLALGKAGVDYDYEVVMFDEIPKYVADGKADAGLLIHEGQLTYAQQGLHLLLDMGVWWHEKTALPLPLGGNCIRKDLGAEAMQEVTDILKKSIQFSLDNRPAAVEYALQFGRDLDRNLADRFVGMYVNHWTLDYGPRGREAISQLLKEGAKAGLVPDAGEIQYVVAGD